MKKTLAFFPFIIPMLVFCCCVNEEKIKENPFISTMVNRCILSNNDSRGSIEFKTNSKWSISIDFDGGKEWFTLSQTSGEAGIFNISIFTSKNELAENRKANIEIVAESASKLIPIFQGVKGNLTIYEKIYNVDLAGNEILVKLDSDTEYTANIPTRFKSWITKIQTKSFSGAERFTIAKGSVDRNGYIVFDYGHQSDTAYIYQRDFKKTFESVDYSKDGQVITLQQATRGSGIDLIFMGDGFVDRDMNRGGKYEETIKKAVEHYFSIEPTKSYREYFNIYLVKAVSRNEVYTNTSNTAFNVSFDRHIILGHENSYIKYAAKAPVKNNKSSQSIIIVNRDAYGGRCYSYKTGESYAFISYSSELQLQALTVHEGVGHGLGNLADEYYVEGTTLSNKDLEKLKYFQSNFGWYLNVDIINEPKKVYWSHIIAEPKFSSYTAIHEGGYNIEKNIWRPELTSSMYDNSLYFNAPSRELIVKRIMQLANLPYLWSEFVSKDIYQPVKNTRNYNSRGINRDIPTIDHDHLIIYE